MVTKTEEEAKEISEFKKTNNSQNNNLLSKDKTMLFDKRRQKKL